GACAWADSWLTLAFTVVVWTFGEMLLFPTVAAHISEIAPPGREGSYMGWLTASFGLAFTLAPGAGLWLLDTHGSRTLWLSVLAVGILSSVVFFFTRIPEERRARADEKSQERDSHGGSHPPPSSRGRAGL
ncbi:MAG: MFS transporter, partial [Polyangiaceae bacterium]